MPPQGTCAHKRLTLLRALLKERAADLLSLKKEEVDSVEARNMHCGEDL